MNLKRWDELLEIAESRKAWPNNMVEVPANDLLELLAIERCAASMYTMDSDPIAVFLQTNMRMTQAQIARCVEAMEEGFSARMGDNAPLVVALPPGAEVQALDADGVLSLSRVLHKILARATEIRSGRRNA